MSDTNLELVKTEYYTYYPAAFYRNDDRYVWYFPKPNCSDTFGCNPAITVVGTHNFQYLNVHAAILLERLGWYAFVGSRDVQDIDNLHDPDNRYNLICPHVGAASYYNSTKHMIEMSRALFVVRVNGFYGPLTEDFVRHAEHCGKKIFYSDDYILNKEEV